MIWALSKIFCFRTLSCMWSTRQDKMSTASSQPSMPSTSMGENLQSPNISTNKCRPVSPRYVLVYSINNQKSFEVVQVLPLLEAMILTHCRCCTTRLPTWLETPGCLLFLLATRKTWRWKGVIWFSIWTMNIYLIFFSRNTIQVEFEILAALATLGCQ